MRRVRQPRGYALLFVVLILLMMTIGAGAYFEMSARNQLTSVAGSGEQIAFARAQAAAQQAVLDLRSNTVSVAGLIARADPDGLADCTYFCVPSTLHDNGTALPLAQGGGLQWDYLIYKSNRVGTPTHRYIIQGNGYYGYTTTSASFTSSRVEVEIDLGIGGGGSGPPPNSEGSGAI
jgi:hypothetical protein